MAAPLNLRVAGREKRVRLLIVPAILTALAIPIDVFAWLTGNSDLLYSALYWEVLGWGGALLFLTGARVEAFLGPPSS